MATEKKLVTETKLCFDPKCINDILEAIDRDPQISPKGLAQIDFFSHMTQILRFKGEMIDMTLEREVDVPEDEVPNQETPSGNEVTAPVQNK